MLGFYPLSDKPLSALADTIFGAFAATENADTMSSSGLQSIFAAFAATEASDTMVAAGLQASNEPEGGGGYIYKYQRDKKKRDVIEEVMAEFRDAIEKETAVPESKFNKLLSVFDRARFNEIQRQIDIINKRIEEQRFLDQLAQERADLRKLIFVAENSLMQELRLMQEDEEMLLVLGV
jgi:hypothetical protein